MEAVILAGGKGTRLRPYTTEIPKPLVSIGESPIIEILLRGMKRSGVRKVHLAVNHLAHLITAVLGNGEKLGMDIRYSHESKPLSTVGPLKELTDLPDDFIVANGDILTNLDFRDLFEYHLKGKSLVTVATHTRTSRVDYGVIEVGSDGLATGFKEKPSNQITVSMGIYVFSRAVLDFVPKRTAFGFDDLMLTLLKYKKPVNTYPFDGYWLDIGRPDDCEQARRDVERLEFLRQ